MDSSDEARVFLIARDLIAEHGDDVARFLQDRIDVLTAAKDYNQLSEWFVIRNAVALSLGSGPTLQ
ncbi:hypothetical protein GCM10009087_30170 [Sphingomonas oligophenolica]|uniref:Uncharacterized protein n=1 Tax=Sphingomonas oligophenolica TaxID=301154 RepID=A0ABU9Y6D0_9SPHN